MFIYKKYEKPAGNNKLALLTAFAGDGDTCVDLIPYCQPKMVQKHWEM